MTRVTPVILLSMLASSMATPILPGLKVAAFGDQVYAWTTGFQVAQAVVLLGASPFLGRWSDVVGRKPAMLLSLAMGVVPGAALAATRSVWAYMWLDLAIGYVGMMVPYQVAVNVTGDVYADDVQAVALGQLFAVFAVAFAAGPSLGEAAREASLARGMSEVSVVFSACVALRLMALLTAAVWMRETLPPRSRLRRGRGREGERSGGGWGGTVSGVVASGRHMWAHPTLRMLCLATLFQSMSEQGVMDVVALYLKREVDFGDDQMATLYTVIGSCGLLVQLVLLPVLRVSGMSNKHMMVIGNAFNVLHLFVYGIARSPTQVYLNGAIASLAIISMPATLAIVKQCSSSNDLGTTQGFLQAISGLTATVAPFLFGGMLYSGLGSITFIVGGCLATVGLGFSSAVPIPIESEDEDEEGIGLLADPTDAYVSLPGAASDGESEAEGEGEGEGRL